jgi:hypothetical protein
MDSGDAAGDPDVPLSRRVERLTRLAPDAYRFGYTLIGLFEASGEIWHR